MADTRRVAPSSAAPPGMTGTDALPVPESRTPGPEAGDLPGSRAGRVLASVALACLCAVVLNTGVQVLPDDALAEGVPVLSLLTAQRLLVLVGLLALVLASPRPSTFVTPVDVPLLLLVALAAVASLRADQSLAPWRSLVTVVLAMYLTVGVLRRHRDGGPVLLVAVLAAAVAAGGTGLAQYAQDVDTQFYRDGLRNVETATATSVTRATGTFSNPNLLAGFLVLALPLSAALAVQRSTARLRVAWWVLVAVAAGGLVVTFSRAAGAALLVVALGAAVLGAARRPATRRVAVAVVAAVGVLAVAGVVAALVVGVLARVSGRDDLWDAALDAAARGGATGNGYGRAGDVMTAVSGSDYAHAHNLWLNWLVDTGPLGPVLLTAVLVLAVAAGARRAAGGSAVAAAGVAAVVALCLASLTDHPTAVARNLLLALVAVGCAVGAGAPAVAAVGSHVGEGAAGAPGIARSPGGRRASSRDPAAVEDPPVPATSGWAPDDGAGGGPEGADEDASGAPDHGASAPRPWTDTDVAVLPPRVPRPDGAVPPPVRPQPSPDGRGGGAGRTAARGR